MKTVRLLIILFIATTMIMGCSNQDPLLPTGGIPKWASSLMKTVPYDSQHVIFLDLDTLQTDPDLQLYFSYQQDWFNKSTYLSQIINSDQVDYWMSCSYGDLVTGSFSIGAAESLLLDDGWVQYEYEGFTVWEKEETWGQVANIAFGQEYAISGSNDSCNAIIHTINDKQQSIYNVTRFQDLMTQLPNTGFEIIYADSNFTTRAGYSIRLLTGNAVSKLNNNTLRYTYILTTQEEIISDDVIEDLINDLKDYNEAFGQTEIKVTRHGLYVTITADIPISSFGEHK